MVFQATEQTVIGLHVGRFFALGNRASYSLNLCCDFGNYGRNDFILHIKQLVHSAIVFIRPDVIATLCVDELPCHPDTLSHFSDCTFKGIRDAELAPNLPHVKTTFLEGKACVSRDNKYLPKSG
jgi:hypothetical protein